MHSRTKCCKTFLKQSFQLSFYARMSTHARTRSKEASQDAFKIFPSILLIQQFSACVEMGTCALRSKQASQNILSSVPLLLCKCPHRYALLSDPSVRRSRAHSKTLRCKLTEVMHRKPSIDQRKRYSVDAGRPQTPIRLHQKHFSVSDHSTHTLEQGAHEQAHVHVHARNDIKLNTRRK